MFSSPSSRHRFAKSHQPGGPKALKKKSNKNKMLDFKSFHHFQFFYRKAPSQLKSRSLRVPRLFLRRSGPWSLCYLLVQMLSTLNLFQFSKDCPLETLPNVAHSHMRPTSNQPPITFDLVPRATPSPQPLPKKAPPAELPTRKVPPREFQASGMASAPSASQAGPTSAPQPLQAKPPPPGIPVPCKAPPEKSPPEKAPPHKAPEETVVTRKAPPAQLMSKQGVPIKAPPMCVSDMAGGNHFFGKELNQRNQQHLYVLGCSKKKSCRGCSKTGSQGGAPKNDNESLKYFPCKIHRVFADMHKRLDERNLPMSQMEVACRFARLLRLLGSLLHLPGMFLLCASMGWVIFF